LGLIERQNLNDKDTAVSYVGTMRKFTGLALMAAAALAVNSAYAGDKDKDGGCCATHANNKMDCSQTYAKLNLSAEQKTKMDAIVTKCNKDGCTKESMDAFMKSAEGILSKEQLATLKAECNKMHEKKDAKA
jgi:Spy/CpxP family protein refolding chaperone